MGQYSIVDARNARINLAKCEYSMLYVFYEMGWRDSASFFCFAKGFGVSGPASIVIEKVLGLKT